jgi:aryl-alcohol dehydrogenase-like predicted oxidoreductase
VTIGSRLVLGSADLRDDSATAPLLDRFHEAGGRFLDVANVYADGESSRAVGAWIASRGLRDDVVLYAKGCHPPYCSPSLVAAEVGKALTDLGVDRLDVFSLHRDDPEVPVEAFAEALVGQVENGSIDGFGVSNWTMPRLRALADCLDGDRGRLVAFSNHFSLGEMVTPTWPGCLAMTKADMAELAEGGIQALAWASLAAGYFAGREAPSWDDPVNEARRLRARELAEEVGSSPATVALSYVLNQPSHVLALVGTRSRAHLEEALSASGIRLTSEQLSWLEDGGRAA